MTPHQFRTIRRALGLSIEGLRRLLGIGNERTIRRWEKNEWPIPGPVKRLMWLLEHRWISVEDLENISKKLEEDQ